MSRLRQGRVGFAVHRANWPPTAARQRYSTNGRKYLHEPKRRMTSNSKQEQDSLANRPWFGSERLGVLVASVASLSVLASFFYDWGFLTALGLSLSTSPTTIADHVRSWVVWLPNTSIVVFLVILSELSLQRFELGMTEEEIAETTPDPERTRRTRRRPYLFLLVIALLGMLTFLLFGTRRSSILFFATGFVAFWSIVTTWFFQPWRMRARYPALLRPTIKYAPMCAMFFFAWGYSGAIAASGSPNYRIHMQSSFSGPEPLEAVVVRIFEEWVLMRNGENGATWIRIADIQRMDSLEDGLGFPGLLCTLASSLCP